MQYKAAVSVLMWLLAIVSKTCLCHSSSRSYLLLPSQAHIFAFLNNTLSEMGTLKGIFMLLKLCIFCGMSEFYCLDLSENLSRFS